MDSLAKQRREQDEQHAILPQSSPLPNEKWQIFTSTEKICRDVDE